MLYVLYAEKIAEKNYNPKIYVEIHEYVQYNKFVTISKSRWTRFYRIRGGYCIRIISKYVTFISKYVKYSYKFYNNSIVLKVIL